MLVYVGLGAVVSRAARGYIGGIGEAVLFLALGGGEGRRHGGVLRRARGSASTRWRRCLSPKKTVEGAIGSTAGQASRHGSRSHLGERPIRRLRCGYFLTWGLVMNLAGQFGDLAESLIKRAADIKDS